MFSYLPHPYRSLESWPTVHKPSGFGRKTWSSHGRVEMESLSVEDLQKVAKKLNIRVDGKAKKAYLDAIAPRVGVEAFALNKALQKKKGLTDWLDSLCLDADH